MTKDIENVDKNGIRKILGMTKAYEKDKCFLETEKEQHIPFHQTPSLPTTAVNDINKNQECITNMTCHSRQQTRNVQTAYRKTDKNKKTGIANQQKLCSKRYNLRSSSYQNATLPNSRYCY